MKSREVHPEFSHKQFHNNSERQDDPIDDPDVHKLKTEWGKIYLATFLIFCMNLEKNVLSLADWLYMKQLDSSVTPDYFGLVLGVGRVGHAIATIGFSYWRAKSKTTKNGLLIGKLCDVIGFLLYCGIEFFGSTKRYALMIVYVLVYSIGLGAPVTLRTYIVDCSLPEDRSAVFALRTFATVAGMLLPPVLQLLFTHFEYPGLAIGNESIRLNIFSGPLLVTLIVNLLGMPLIWYYYTEPNTIEQMKKSVHDKQGNPSSTFWSKLYKFMTKPHFSWHLVSMICFIKIIVFCSNSSVMVVHAPWSQVAFGWSPSETVSKLTEAKIYLGIISILITLALFKIGNKVGDHIILVICTVFLLSHFIITYPLPGLTIDRTALFNETTQGGCNPKEYTWCEAQVGNPTVWVYSSIAHMVIFVQIALVASDAIFSNLLEKIDQSMMQGMLVVISDIFSMIASMYSAGLFTRWGLEPLWILNSISCLVILVLSIVYFKRFKE